MLQITDKSFKQSHNDLEDILREIDGEGRWSSIPQEDFIVGTRFGYGPTDESRLVDFMNIVPLQSPGFTVCEEIPGRGVGLQNRQTRTISAELAVVSDFKHQPADLKVAGGLRCLAALRREISRKIINGRDADQEVVGILDLKDSEKLKVDGLSENTLLQIMTKSHMVAGCHPSCIVFNVEDAMRLHGPFGYIPALWDVPIISTVAVPKSTVVAGNFWSQAVMGMRSVRIRVNNRALKMEAEVEAATGHYNPSAFVVAEFDEPDAPLR